MIENADIREQSCIERNEEKKEWIKQTLIENNYELSTMQCLAIAYYEWKISGKSISDLFYALSEVSTIVDGMAKEVKEERERRFWKKVHESFEEYLNKKGDFGNGDNSKRI